MDLNHNVACSQSAVEVDMFYKGVNTWVRTGWNCANDKILTIHFVWT